MTVSGLTDIKRVQKSYTTEKVVLYAAFKKYMNITLMKVKKKKLFILTTLVVSFFNLEAESIDITNGWTII